MAKYCSLGAFVAVIYATWSVTLAMDHGPADHTHNHIDNHTQFYYKMACATDSSELTAQMFGESQCTTVLNEESGSLTTFEITLGECQQSGTPGQSDGMSYQGVCHEDFIQYNYYTTLDCTGEAVHSEGPCFKDDDSDSDSGPECVASCNTEPKTCDEFEAMVSGCAAACETEAPDFLAHYKAELCGSDSGSDSEPECVASCDTEPKTCDEFEAMVSGCAAACETEAPDFLAHYKAELCGECKCTGNMNLMAQYNADNDPDYDLNYGNDCSTPWDATTAACMEGGDSHGEDWCDKLWCYVPAHCDGATATKFFETYGYNLTYSYAQCGAADTFTDTMVPPSPPPPSPPPPGVSDDSGVQHVLGAGCSVVIIGFWAMLAH